MAVIGFRVLTSFSRGDFLYVDDLSTLPPARRQGHATTLLLVHLARPNTGDYGSAANYDP